MRSERSPPASSVECFRPLIPRAECGARKPNCALHPPPAANVLAPGGDMRSVTGRWALGMRRGGGSSGWLKQPLLRSPCLTTDQPTTPPPPRTASALPPWISPPLLRWGAHARSISVKIKAKKERKKKKERVGNIPNNTLPSRDTKAGERDTERAQLSPTPPRVAHPHSCSFNAHRTHAHTHIPHRLPRAGPPAA